LKLWILNDQSPWRWGLVAQRDMGSNGIVRYAPLLNQYFRFLHRIEDFSVKTKPKWMSFFSLRVFILK
jgi:hypothetical protein